MFLHKKLPTKLAIAKLVKAKLGKTKLDKAKLAKAKLAKAMIARAMIAKAKLAKEKLPKAKLAQPTPAKAKLPTTAKLARHCLGFSRRCHSIYLQLSAPYYEQFPLWGAPCKAPRSIENTT